MIYIGFTTVLAGILLDAGGDLEQALVTLVQAMPETGPAPQRIIQAYASMLARQAW